MVKGLLLLAMAIFSEVVATTSLKFSEGFTRLIPSLITITGYGLALYLLSVSLRYIPLGVAYATWSGLGTVGIVIIGAIIWREPVNLMRIVGIALIIIGVVIVTPRHTNGV